MPGCYDELLADPCLLQSFSEDKWTSTHELPHLGAVHFHIVSVELFSQQVSLELWGQARVKFITSSGRQSTGKRIIPMAILVADGSRGGRLGNDNHLLPLWPGKSGAFSHTFDLIPAGFTWTKHSGGEDVHQLTLCPMGVSQLPLPGHNQPFSWHCNKLNFPLPGYAYTGYSCTLPPKSSCSEWRRLKVFPFLKEAL